MFVSMRGKDGDAIVRLKVKWVLARKNDPTESATEWSCIEIRGFEVGKRMSGPLNGPHSGPLELVIH